MLDELKEASLTKHKPLLFIFWLQLRHLAQVFSLAMLNCTPNTKALTGLERSGQQVMGRWQRHWNSFHIFGETSKLASAPHEADDTEGCGKVWMELVSVLFWRGDAATTPTGSNWSCSMTYLTCLFIYIYLKHLEKCELSFLGPLGLSTINIYLIKMALLEVSSWPHI